MPSGKASAPNSVMRHLPSVDELIRSQAARDMIEADGEQYIASIARQAIDALRQEIVKATGSEATKADLLANAESRLDALWSSDKRSRVGKVINATGVIIHTNLGRASLSENARQAVADASGYCTLEYDIETGKRGQRGGRAEDLIVELTGAESALIVNNCADRKSVV